MLVIKIILYLVQRWLDFNLISCTRRNFSNQDKWVILLWVVWTCTHYTFFLQGVNFESISSLLILTQSCDGHYRKWCFYKVLVAIRCVSLRVSVIKVRCLYITVIILKRKLETWALLSRRMQTNEMYILIHSSNLGGCRSWFLNIWIGMLIFFLISRA